MFDASKNFNPNMIKKGSISDCYLISSMAAVSKSTKLVQQMFTDPINNNAGMRCVNLHIMGKIVPSVVDTTIPFNGQSEHAFPIGCKPVKSDDQWWPHLLRKLSLNNMVLIKLFLVEIAILLCTEWLVAFLYNTT